MPGSAGPNGIGKVFLAIIDRIGTEIVGHRAFRFTASGGERLYAKLKEPGAQLFQLVNNVPVLLHMTFLLAAPADDNFRALFGKLDCGGTADTGISASDQSNFSYELTHRVLPP
jgi:hypothetical protein